MGWGQIRFVWSGTIVGLTDILRVSNFSLFCRVQKFFFNFLFIYFKNIYLNNAYILEHCFKLNYGRINRVLYPLFKSIFSKCGIF